MQKNVNKCNDVFFYMCSDVFFIYICNATKNKKKIKTLHKNKNELIITKCKSKYTKLNTNASFFL